MNTSAKCLATGFSVALLHLFGFSFANTSSTVLMVPGEALHFDGKDNHALVASDPSTNFNSGNFTAECWFRVDNSSKDKTGLISSLHSDNGGWSVRVSGKDAIEFVIGDNDKDSDSDIAEAPGVATNTWHHVAAVRQGNSMLIYIDGTLAGSQSTSRAVTHQDLVLGRRYTDKNKDVHNGELDEIRIWNRALSTIEIQARINCELAGDEYGLVRYYKTNQGVAADDNTGLDLLRSDHIANPLDGNLIDFNLNGPTSNWVLGSGLSGDCTIPIPGCLDPNACNYHAAATQDDGNCVQPSSCDTCSGQMDGTGTVISGDQDEDGLCDDDELNLYFTDPNHADSDRDGLTDGAEVLLTLTNPLQSDSNADGCSDLQEYGWQCPDSDPYTLISCPADLNRDGAIGTGDLLMLLVEFGSVCD